MKKTPVLLCLTAMLLASPALAEGSALGGTSSLLAIGALLAAMLVGLFFSAKRVKWNASMIAKAAMCVAIAFVLGEIKLFRMPMGGSVKLIAMFPLILFAYAFGPLEGLLIGCVYGLLDLMIDPYVIHPLQLLVDYPMAYAALALGCAVRVLPIPEKFKLPAAMLLGYLGRYCMAVLSGVVFFAEYAGEQNALVYSLVYNISYLWPEILLSVAAALIPGMNRLPQILKQHSVR